MKGLWRPQRGGRRGDVVAAGRRLAPGCEADRRRSEKDKNKEIKNGGTMFVKWN
jgi:hypothetical protein